MVIIGFLYLENMVVDINFTELQLLVTEVCGDCDILVMATLNQHNMGYPIVEANCNDEH